MYLNDILKRDDADSTACMTRGFADQKEMSSTCLAAFPFQWLSPIRVGSTYK